MSERYGVSEGVVPVGDHRRMSRYFFRGLVFALRRVEELAFDQDGYYLRQRIGQATIVLSTHSTHCMADVGRLSSQEDHKRRLVQGNVWLTISSLPLGNPANSPCTNVSYSIVRPNGIDRDGMYGGILDGMTKSYEEYYRRHGRVTTLDTACPVVYDLTRNTIVINPFADPLLLCISREVSAASVPRDWAPDMHA